MELKDLIVGTFDDLCKGRLIKEEGACDLKAEGLRPRLLETIRYDPRSGRLASVPSPILVQERCSGERKT
jgi:hypothetical protein